MDGSDTFTHTKTIPCWIDQNMCAPMTSWQSLKDFLNITDVIESCTRERMNTKWRFYKLTNLTVFAALLKDVPMGCKNAVLPKPLLKNCTINCLTYEENTRQPYNDNLCLFRAHALHMHGNHRLEGKFRNYSIYSSIKWMD